MPLDNGKNVLNHSCFALPYSAMSSHPSAPLRTAQMEIVMISSSKCSLPRLSLGSSKLAKCVKMLASNTCPWLTALLQLLCNSLAYAIFFMRLPWIATGRAFTDTQFGNQPRAVSYENIPSAVFSNPEAATVGLTEAQARKKYGESVKCYRSKFRPLFHSLTGRDEKTLLKLIVDGNSGGATSI